MKFDGKNGEKWAAIERCCIHLTAKERRRVFFFSFFLDSTIELRSSGICLFSSDLFYLALYPQGPKQTHRHGEQIGGWIPEGKGGWAKGVKGVHCAVTDGNWASEDDH